MYAIVESGGKQYRVEKGQALLVDRLPADEGAKVSLRPLLYRSDKVVFDAKQLEKVRVEAVVAGHLRGPKIRVFKYKPKKGYRRQAGHRSELTRLEIREIKMVAAKPAAAKPAAKKEAAKPAAKAAAKGAAKPAARKPAAKAAAARKPAAKRKEKPSGA